MARFPAESPWNRLAASCNPIPPNTRAGGDAFWRAVPEHPGTPRAEGHPATRRRLFSAAERATPRPRARGPELLRSPEANVEREGDLREMPHVDSDQDQHMQQGPDERPRLAEIP